MVVMMLALTTVKADHPARIVDGQVLKTGHVEIKENVLYEGLSQFSRTHKFFKVTATRQFYTGNQHMTFKLIADGFGSDPDIYIARTTQQYPTSPDNAQWYCEKKGSDTCILKNGDFAVGETLYFSVFCVDNCNYKLRIYYASEINLSASNRYQHTFDAYSTSILTFTIPESVGGKETQSLEVGIEPETQYSSMELYMSLDSEFQIIEEKPATHMTSTSLAIKFSKLDSKWCTKCTVYLIFNVERGDRYYITTTPRASNDQISDLLPSTVYANSFHQECYTYFILRANYDLVVNLEGYQGQADFYASPKLVPAGPTSDSIKIRASQGPSRQLILTSQDRRDLDVSTGSINFCVYPYTAFSGSLKVSEAYYGKKFDSIDGIIKTQILANGNWTYSRYSNPGFSRDGQLYIYVETQGVVDSTPTVYYTLCQNSLADCTLDETLTDPAAFGYTELTGTKAGANGIEINLPHKASSCPNGANNCNYLFVLYNKKVDGAASKTVSMMVQASLTNPGDVLLSRSYVNEITAGRYFYYEVSRNLNTDILPYLQSLTIKLQTYRGDADLFVSTSSSNQNPTIQTNDYSSRTGLIYDQIIIERSQGGDFPQNIYIGVFASTYAQYELSFTYTSQPNFNEALSSAAKIAENNKIQEIIYDEYQTPKLYQYCPWWSGRENRTAVFFADVLVNKITFYSDWDKYPKHFETSLHDTNDSLAIFGNSPYSHFNGSYYIRVRPDFELADLLSRRQYVYDFYAFSMAPAVIGNNVSEGFDTLDLGKEVLGISNQSIFQEYRYFIMKESAAFNINLTRVPGQGDPIFYVHTSNSEDLTVGATARKFYSSQATPGTGGTSQTFQYTQAMRQANPRCGTISHSLQQDGSQACFIVISVTCKYVTRSQCAYRLRIDQDGYEPKNYTSTATFQGDAPPPQGIITQDYVNGQIGANNQIKYYFMPVNYTTKKEAMILVNKTKMSNLAQNGNTKIMVKIQGDIDKTPDYTKWLQYPNFGDVADPTQLSNTGDVDYPEIVEVCEQTLTSACKDVRGCAIIAGVVGMTTTDAPLAEYRVKGFFGDNKIYNNKPIKKSKSADLYGPGSEEWDFYWFVINDVALNSAAQFDYHIAVAGDTGDPDLYVTLMDGRFPSSDDYDLVSQKKGADFIEIASDSPIWNQKGWKTKYGVVVVVGVRTRSATNYTLVMNKPVIDAPERSMTFMRVSDVPVTKKLAATGTTKRTTDNEQVYMIYNWDHKDFSITLKMDQANGTIMVGKSGQLDYKSNVFTGVPINQNNSDHYHTVQEGSYVTVNIPGNECYTCWYFVRTLFENPAETSYKLSTSKVDRGGTLYKDLKVGSTEDINIARTQWTFTLDNMANWDLKMTLTSGEASLIVGTDPTKIGSTGIWTAKIPVGSQDRVAKISVQQTDYNFNLGTTYYVYVKKEGLQNFEGKLQLVQDRQVFFVGNNKDYTYQLTHPVFNAWRLAQKFTFMTVKEQVKFHIFQAPPGTTTAPVYHKINIYLTPLTENLYMSVYLNRTGYDSNAVDKFSTLKFPSLQEYLLGFVTQPVKDVDTGASSYKLTYYGKSESKYTYYTCAIYQQNWGLTNKLKSEYQLRIETDIVPQNEGEQNIANQITSGLQTEALPTASSGTPEAAFIQ